MICRFGWTNASYVYGLSLLGMEARKALNEGLNYDEYRQCLEETKS